MDDDAAVGSLVMPSLCGCVRKVRSVRKKTGNYCECTSELEGRWVEDKRVLCLTVCEGISCLSLVTMSRQRKEM